MSPRASRSPFPPVQSSRSSWKCLWTQGKWGLVVGGIVLLAVVGPEWFSRPLVQLVLPLLLIAGLITWRLRRWRRRSEEGRYSPYWVNVAKKTWRPRGSGFYALVAMATFVGLQGALLFNRSREVWGTWRDAPYADGGAFIDFLSGQLWGGVIEVVAAVSVKTVLNVVWAGLWPIFWLQNYGVAVAAGAILGVYALYRGARYRFPQFDAIMRQVDVSNEADHLPEGTQVDPEQKDALPAQAGAEEAPRKR